MERTYEAPSNEAPHMILGYHQGRLVTYLQNHFNFSRQWHVAKPRTGMLIFKQFFKPNSNIGPQLDVSWERFGFVESNLL